MATKQATTVAAPPCDVRTRNSSRVLGYMSSSRSFSKAAMAAGGTLRVATGGALVTPRLLAQDCTDDTKCA